jgi:hypothetical protein
MEHRRLMILFALISLFAFGVILWYFLFSTPTSAPSIGGTSNPLSVRDLPARFGFIFGSGDDAPSTTETEVTLPGTQPFLQVWDKPATGNTIVSRSILKEVVATTTQGTSTVQVTKTIRATTTVLMFVDRSTGYIYGHAIESGKTYQISNTTVPGLYDAYIWSGGERVVMRYLDSSRKNIVSILASVPDVSEDRSAQPLSSITYLPNNISSVAVSQSLQSFSYLVQNGIGSSIYTQTPKGVTHVADSSFGEWLLSYGEEKLYATTKASAYVQGETVSIPSYTRLIGEKTGLTSLPSAGGLLLNSMWSQSGLATFMTNGASIVQTSARTLAAKCSPGVGTFFICGVPKTLPQFSEGLPDDWYQGGVSFDDTLMLVDAKNGDTYPLYEFESRFGSVDVTHIRTNRAATLISFIRKQDGSLFLLNTSLISVDD